MNSGSPAGEVRYFVSLLNDEASGYAQSIHPAIAQKYLKASLMALLKFMR